MVMAAHLVGLKLMAVDWSQVGTLMLHFLALYFLEYIDQCMLLHILGSFSNKFILEQVNIHNFLVQF